MEQVAPHPRVLVVSGDVHSGKTTHLTAWCAARESEGTQLRGFLAGPDVPVGDGPSAPALRHVTMLPSREVLRLQLAPGEDTGARPTVASSQGCHPLPKSNSS
eukprot:m51a1_g13784 hypothetical protein (103) ;mRNA; f:313846-316854